MPTATRKRWPEWLIIIAVAVVLAAMHPPTPHWRETSSQSCHLCGNRRVIVTNYRWWRIDSEKIEPAATFPVPEAHRHEWWQYAATHSSYSLSWASDNAARYKDGRNTWTAAEGGEQQ